MKRNNAPRSSCLTRSYGSKMNIGIAAVFMLMLFYCVIRPQKAHAVYECGGVQDTCNCGGNNFCICCSDSSNGTDHGNCVWYAWHKACCVWSINLEWCTNADTWDGYATSNGYPVNTTACVDTVFVCEADTTQCWAGGVGHVGWVNHVYPDGSIDVEEQGCYGWYGVQTRNFAAQNASPTMHYIYEPSTGGTCASCDCNPGQTEDDPCGNCGTKSRTCGSDCLWGAWSDCQNEGVCQSGDTQNCGNCGTQTCQSDCSWGPCENEGVCQSGDTQNCGNCGTQTCQSDCSWGLCDDPCAGEDSGVGVDTGVETDGGGVGVDVQLWEDAQTPSVDEPSSYVGGCGCRTLGAPSNPPFGGRLSINGRRPQPGRSPASQLLLLFLFVGLSFRSIRPR